MLSPVAFIKRATPWRLQIRGKVLGGRSGARLCSGWSWKPGWDNKEMKTEQTQAQKEKLEDGEPRHWFWKLS